MSLKNSILFSLIKKNVVMLRNFIVKIGWRGEVAESLVNRVMLQCQDLSIEWDVNVQVTLKISWTCSLCTSRTNID